MPTVHTIGSIKIKLYYKDHLPPHFHAQYNEFEILIEIRSLEKYAGDLPKKQLKAVLEWAAENQEELMERWDEYFNEN
ncbi:DUF4160 domain-containing protein [Lewinella sp. 4G2]|uniref:DUF4160 domain-containing protein n=1 Tax=Lewinella sp. 4G2 TaxID=1803372 RepID=UPI0007E11DA9|nr:DUF4160 domain-containing protein [Lewinella sp. 4G2]OAV45090.1 hypothetical protein A3850_011590 [Lewinella sp. 4G2]